MTRTVKVKGTDVLVKTIAVKDDSGTIKVSLWRGLTSQSNVGKYMQLTNLVVTSFNDETSVSTTTRTSISVRNHSAMCLF